MAEIKLLGTAAQFDPSRVQVVEHQAFGSGSGVRLAAGAAAEAAGEKPDLRFQVTIPEDGRYQLSGLSAASYGAGRELMLRSHDKYDSLRIRLAIDDDFPRSLVIVVGWKDQDDCREFLRYADFKAGTHELKVWLSDGVLLEGLSVEPMKPTEIPADADTYEPPVIPDAAHPRIWITPATREEIRRNLHTAENAPVWEDLQRVAAEPCQFTAPVRAVTGYEPELLKKLVCRAFYYQMTGDVACGRHAAAVLIEYLKSVEFDNLLDITRELGNVLYSGACVYDWCWEVLTPLERKLCRDNLLRLAEGMEIGWPPFLQPVVNGHGNEAQVSRDLLAMAIAFYGEDDRPYQLTSYLMLHELLPLREREYWCERHNQGIGYAAYRFGWEMTGAWMLRRMTGREIFHSNIGSVYTYWQYFRRPEGCMVLEGDANIRENIEWWHAPYLSFVCGTYTNDPLIKGDFVRAGGRIDDWPMFLCLNNPDLKPEMSPAGLPTVHCFRGVLPGILYRTGWNFGEDSNDAVVALRGSGWYFCNHQHPDAGSFQIFYHGALAFDLGLYAYYGTAYDMGYNKRSISHNTMLVYNPDEIFRRASDGRSINDGGQRLVQEPLVLRASDLKRDSVFFLGDTLGLAAIPGDCAWLSSELAPAYSDKVRRYRRDFCLLEMDDPERPLALIVVDHITSSDAGFTKYFLLNSLTEPEVVDNHCFRIISDAPEHQSHLTCRTFLPEAVEVSRLGGKPGACSNVFGVELGTPFEKHPCSRGWRTMIAPAVAQETDLFVHVMTVEGEGAAPLPVGFTRLDNIGLITAGGRAALVPLTTDRISGAVEFELAAAASVVCCGLTAGTWQIGDDVLTVDTIGTPLRLDLAAGKHRIAPVML